MTKLRSEDLALSFVLLSSAACGGGLDPNYWMSGGNAPGSGEAGASTPRAGEAGVGDGGLPTAADSSGAGQEAVTAVSAPDPSVYDTPTKCSSGITIHQSEGASMTPGEACNSCHGSGEAQAFSIAGTVFKTAHEPNDCSGVNVSGATVTITDARNQKLTLTVNSAGNFYSTRAIALPYQAEVGYAGNTRTMLTTQTVGDCNSCHTLAGTNLAPGRIMLP